MLAVAIAAVSVLAPRRPGGFPARCLAMGRGGNPRCETRIARANPPRRARAGQAKVKLPAVDVDVCDDDANRRAQANLPAASPTAELVRDGVEIVLVVVERRNVDEPFGGDLDGLTEKSPVLNAGDDRVEFVADAA